jgi:hypothetical protein
MPSACGHMSPEIDYFIGTFDRLHTSLVGSAVFSHASAPSNAMFFAVSWFAFWEKENE